MIADDSRLQMSIQYPEKLDAQNERTIKQHRTTFNGGHLQRTVWEIGWMPSLSIVNKDLENLRLDVNKSNRTIRIQ